MAEGLVSFIVMVKEGCCPGMFCTKIGNCSQTAGGIKVQKASQVRRLVVDKEKLTPTEVMI